MSASTRRLESNGHTPKLTGSQARAAPADEMSIKVAVGDEVQLLPQFEAIGRRVYGDAAVQAFIVEATDRARGRWMVTGAGLMFWRTHVRRLRTARRLARERARRA